MFELTPDTVQNHTFLSDFLIKTRDKKSSEQQMTKFTTKDPTTGQRYFIKGPIDQPHPDTNLATVPPDMEEQIRAAFTKTHYGATMMKLGTEKQARTMGKCSTAYSMVALLEVFMGLSHLVLSTFACSLCIMACY